MYWEVSGFVLLFLPSTATAYTQQVKTMRERETVKKWNKRTRTSRYIKRFIWVLCLIMFYVWVSGRCKMCSVYCALMTQVFLSFVHFVRSFVCRLVCCCFFILFVYVNIVGSFIRLVWLLFFIFSLFFIFCWCFSELFFLFGLFWVLRIISLSWYAPIQTE